MRDWKFNHIDFSTYPVYMGDDLGVFWSPQKTSFKIWAPTANQVELNLYENGKDGLPFSVISLEPDECGTWKTELAGGMNNNFVTLLSDGKFAFAHSGGSLYCLDLASGKILWSDGLSGYGYGMASLCFPSGGEAPNIAAVQKIMNDRRSSASG